MDGPLKYFPEWVSVKNHAKFVCGLEYYSRGLYKNI